MRLLGMAVFLILVQLSVGLFWNNLSTDSLTINPYSDESSMRLWDFIFNPTLWTDSGFWVLITSVITIGAGIAIGTLFGAKSDLTYLFGLFVFFAAFGALPVASLYLVVYSEVGVFAGCDIGATGCLPATFVAFFASGILAITWIFTCIEWWSGRPAT